MNSYEQIARYYDALVQDLEATQLWVDFVKKHAEKHKLMDLACGSGDIAIELAKNGFEVYASDIEEEMLSKAKEKVNHELVMWSKQDMRKFSLDKKMDTITCFCDSINYLLDENDVSDMFQSVYEALNENGVFLFDVHSLDRMEEFKDEFLEEGNVCNIDYEWSILSVQDLIYQNFVFFDTSVTTRVQHVQKVYHPEWLTDTLEKLGFKVSIYTDFIHEGIQPGEKYFFIAKKGN